GFTSREFMQALRGGMHGKVAVTYFEWAGPYDQKIVVPWRMIDGPEAADAFVNEIARAPYRRASRTSISGALTFAKHQLLPSGWLPQPATWPILSSLSSTFAPLSSPWEQLDLHSWPPPIGANAGVTASRPNRAWEQTVPGWWPSIVPSLPSGGILG